MKRILSILICLILATSLFASFSFTLGPNKPFFSSFSSDLLSSHSRLEALKVADSNFEGNYIRFDKNESGVPGEYYEEFLNYNEDKDSLFLHLQTGGSTSLFRFSFSPFVELDLTISAHLSSIFYLLRGNDLLGFDGVYVMGAEAKVLDKILLRGGIRHFSGHIGDEVLTSLYNRKPELIRAQMTAIVLDSYELTLGYYDEEFPYIKGAIGLIIPQKESYMEPFVHRPDWIISGGKANSERDPSSYAARGDYGKDYNALTYYGELTLTMPFSKGEVFFSFLPTLYENGKTNHTLDPSDDSNKMELSYELRLGLILKGTNINTSVEIFYINGRFPLLNMYWKHGSQFGFGFSMN